MQFQLLDILPELALYVKSVCVILLPCNCEPVTIRVLPDGCTELFVSINAKSETNIGATSHKGSFINCRVKTYADVVMQPGSEYVAICFFPGAAAYFFPQISRSAKPVAELETVSTSLSALINDLIVSGHASPEVSRCIQVALIELKSGESNHKRVIFSLLQDLEGVQKVATLARELNVSERQFNRIFYHVLGVSPKEYLRLHRFLNSLQILKTQKRAKLTGVALNSGYYDQAHFIRDCRVFSGHSPRNLLRDGRLVY